MIFLVFSAVLLVPSSDRSNSSHLSSGLRDQQVAWGPTGGSEGPEQRTSIMTAAFIPEPVSSNPSSVQFASREEPVKGLNSPATITTGSQQAQQAHHSHNRLKTGSQQPQQAHNRLTTGSQQPRNRLTTASQKAYYRSFQGNTVQINIEHI